MKKYLTIKWSVITIAIFCAVLWGSAFPVLKITYEELQMASDDTKAKLVLAGARFLAAGLVLLIAVWIINRDAMYIPMKRIPTLIIFGIVQTSLQYYFFYNGLAKTTGMQGSILDASGTFFTVILAHYFYVNDKMNWQKVVGLITGFTGIILVNWDQGFSVNFQFTGEGYMILAALTGAVGTIMAKEMAVGIHPFTLTGWQLTIGSVLLLAVGLPGLQENAMTFTPLGWGLFIYSAFLSAIAFALWYSLLKYNKAGEISIYKFVTPVSGAILSAIFIPGESLSWFVAASLALVAVGFVAVNYKTKQETVQKVEE